MKHVFSRLGCAPPQDLICKVEYRLCAPEILLEFDDAASRKFVGKCHDILDCRSPEGIDRLRVVPDDHDILVLKSEQLYNFCLDLVGVLVFVHHDVFVSLREGRSNVVVFPEQSGKVE